MKGTKIVAILIGFLIASDCNGQFTDNFSDGDFTNNPSWSGDNPKFTINGGKLKLQAVAVSEGAFLSTSSQAMHLATWEFYLQMDFVPSSTNFARIYLVSDQPNLNGPLNGYFIKVGNTTRDVSLYRQSGTTETRMIDGLDDRVNLSSVKIKIKASRNASGVWQLFSDAGITGTYTSEGIATDNTFTASSYFGVQCTYTSTRSDKFWFDDFVVTGTPVPDTSPPVLISTTTLGQQDASLLFSEPLDRTSSQNPSSYLVLTLGPAEQAVLQPDQKTVRIHFSSALVNGFSYTLQVNGVKDLAGNTMNITRQALLFFQPVPSKTKDIIFTEFFPDPSPQLGLPNAEFVEIYNRSHDPFNVGGWKLSDGSSTGIFPSQIILPGEYWIVTAAASVGLFSGFGKTLGLSNFPTLNNGGDAITFKDTNNLTIDSINYTLAWYRDSDKQEGGWTLELIDPTNPCGEEDNWEASTDPRGGTPGKQNSVIANKPDLTPPSLFSVFPEQPTRLVLSFDEKLNAASLGSGNFQLKPSVSVSHASFKDIGQRTILLDLQDSMALRQLYSLEISAIRDCSGNDASPFSVLFGLPERADSMDVVVNEILFNPRSGGVDFVEAFNKSPKFLNLKHWKIGNTVNGSATNIVELFQEDRLLPPNGYAVFTPNPGTIKLQYPESIERNLFKVTLPSLRDDQSSVAMLDDQGKLVDGVSYAQDWHSPFLKNTEGVSLERIVPQGRSNDRMNWISGSSVTGFATPGFANSQLELQGEPAEGEVVVVPEIFSPGPGTNEFVRIEYHFDRGAWVGNVKVMDQQHRLLKIIADNETLGTQGFFRWDGDRDDGDKARMGYYVIWFEIFNSDGTVRTFRKRVIVLARQ